MKFYIMFHIMKDIFLGTIDEFCILFSKIRTEESVAPPTPWEHLHKEWKRQQFFSIFCKAVFRVNSILTGYNFS